MWLAELAEIHRHLCSYGNSKGLGPAYVLDSSKYLSPWPTHLTHQALTQFFLQSDQAGVISLIHTIVHDQQLLDDYYAIALCDAHEEVLRSIDAVWQSQIRLPWCIQPAFKDGILWLDQDGKLAIYIESQLHSLSEEIGGHGFERGANTYKRIEGLRRLLSAAKRAFSVATTCLNTLDMELQIAALIRNEALAELVPDIRV